MNELILVLDFGGQYKELIARTVRGLNVYSEIKPGSLSAEKIKKLSPKGIILTGGPDSVYRDNAPKCDAEIFRLGIPILGICYGMQLICYSLGGKVEPCVVSEYGRISINFDTDAELFWGIRKTSSALMSHTDQVIKLPKGFVGTAETPDCKYAAAENRTEKLYAVQFHPEVEHTDDGEQIIRNFLYNICGVSGDYRLDDYLNTQIKSIRSKVGNERVLLGLSGGVDSSVCAALLSKAIPNRLTCIFVDHGFMRQNEGDEIEKVFFGKKLHFIRVNAQDRFLDKLKGVTDPEKKRKIIGAEFAKVFEEEAAKLGDIKYLAQGTIYPDLIESGGELGALIKSHHNVGGLPSNLSFIGVIEPLSGLFKDEVRALGKKLGLPEKLVGRQPFPGPGLAVRIMGEITKHKLDILRQADRILCDEIKKLKNKPQQYFAVFTDVRSVGVKGDGRTYDYVIAIRAVNTRDFMTCDYAPLPHKLLARISSRIVNEVKEISRVVYDITSKPPATVEWE
ncbi:MAG TPA: glutamine-hydrolyzing GMP synthase [Eubacteriales bacterium]|jgi:GMP synthase (glutamine-hydrolysing)|nr:glutamine-hydrolyzing GMP synthase [Clostridia bacterium]HRR90370.1 glutamine-hydrolyzing GMP synthase [Eubacteriales bacterium]HRU84368.1 glutamine-hydrolyzing GMP synthase [Eubacteriales bacterium]